MHGRKTESRDPDRAVGESQNPATGVSDAPVARPKAHQTLVHPEEAERAAERALADEPVTKEEILEQSEYRGPEMDVGQQAATSDRAKAAARRRRPASGS